MITQFLLGDAPDICMLLHLIQYRVLIIIGFNKLPEIKSQSRMLSTTINRN